MQIIVPQMRSVVTERMVHPEPVQRQEEGFVALPESSVLADRRWDLLTIPKSDRWVELPDPQQMPFAALGDEYLASYEQYRSFQASTQSISHLSGYTGLLAYAFGNLWQEGETGATPDAAQKFLETYSWMISGRQQEIGLRLDSYTRWKDETTTLAFQQVNKQQIPVVGAQIVLTYDSFGRLALLDSSLYPATLDELPTFPPSLPEDGKLKQAIVENLEWYYEKRIELAELFYVRYEPSEEFYSIFALDGKVRPFELWILPHLVEERGRYTAAYRTFFLDGEGHAWAMWLSAVNLNFLFLERRESFNRLAYEVYPRPRDVLNGQPKPRILDLGGNPPTLNTLTTALAIHVSGPRFHDPRDPASLPNPPLTGPADPRNVLAANVFFHLWEVKFDFSNWMDEQQVHVEDDQHVNNRIIFNPVNEISSLLEDTPGEGRFRWEDGVIVLHTGVGGNPPVKEAGLDGDVITHEYVHAVLHYYYRHLFENPGAIPLYYTAVDALDEGVAFFFACVHFKDGQWGEFAYEGFANRTFSSPILPFANVATAASVPGGNYEYALWWAHIFWHLYMQNALQPILPVLLLQVLRSLSQSPPNTENLNGTSSAKLFTIFNRIADQIYLRAQVGAERNAIEQIWMQCGFTVHV